MYNNSVQRFAAQINNSLYIERANRSANWSANWSANRSQIGVQIAILNRADNKMFVDAKVANQNSANLLNS